MKKRILSLFLIVAMLLSMMSVAVSAATDPVITSHTNGKSYDADDFYIKWKAVDGAKRYRLAVKSETDGSYAADIWWDDGLTKNYYEVDEDDIKPGHSYKIWVGACGSGHDDVLSQYSIVVKANKLVISDPVITSHTNGKSYDADDFYIKWKAVDGAKRYRLAVKSETDGSYAADIWWDDGLTKNYYEVDEDDIKPGHSYKIWVGACGSGHDDVLSQYSIVVATKAQEVVKDTTPPSVKIKSPNVSATYNSDYYNEINFDAVAEDSSGIKSMVLYKNGYSYTSSNTNTLSIDIPFDELNDGRNEFQVVAVDNCGNSKTESAFIYIEKPAKSNSVVPPVIEEEKDTQAPVVYTFVSDCGSTVNRDEIDTITFKAQASDNKGIAEMELCYNGVAIDFESGSGITSTIQTSALSLGENEFYIIAEDEAGNEAYSNPTYITITENSFSDTPQQGKGETKPDGTWDDQPEPEKDSESPVIKELYCKEGDEINANSVREVTIVVKATDNEELDYANFSLSGIGEIGRVYFDDTDRSTMSIEVSSCYQGYNVVSVTAVDKAGNKSYSEDVGFNIVQGSFSDTPEHRRTELHNKAYNNTGSNKNVDVCVNGYTVYFDVLPTIMNSRTMVPLRAIFESLGADVNWDNDTKTITSYKDGTTIKMTIGNSYMYVNNTAVWLDSPPVIVDGRTLVPVRAISEAFNCDVEWYSDKELVSIVSDDE